MSKGSSGRVSTRGCYGVGYLGIFLSRTDTKKGESKIKSRNKKKTRRRHINQTQGIVRNGYLGIDPPLQCWWDGMGSPSSPSDISQASIMEALGLGSISIDGNFSRVSSGLELTMHWTDSSFSLQFAGCCIPIDRGYPWKSSSTHLQYSTVGTYFRSACYLTLVVRNTVLSVFF